MPFITKLGSVAARAYGWIATTVAVTANDVYFYLVSLLLPGNGTNGAQNNTFLDSSTNNFTITRNGNTTQGTFSPFSQTGWSNYFDGTGDYLSIASNAAFNFGTGDFTIEFWLFLSSPSTTQVFLDIRNAGVGLVFYSSGGVLYVNKDNSGSVLITGGSLTGSTWLHIALSRSSGANKLFINGAQSGSTATDSTNYPTNPVYIGGNFSGGQLTTGYISNLRVVKGTAVYTSNFTPPTVPLTAIANTSLLTCQSNRFVDNSTNNFTVTRNGDVTVTANSPFNPTAAWSATTNGGSGYFDGTGDYLTAPNNAAFNFGSGDFTLECWVYRTSDADGKAILTYGWPSLSAPPFLIYWDGLNNRYSFFASSASTYDIASGVIIGAAPPLNTWGHIAVTRSGNTIRCFFNGVLGSTTTSSLALFNNTTQPLTIGAGSTGVNNFFGFISNLRVVKGTAVYTSAFTPPTAPVTAITNTSLLLNYTNAGILDAASQNVLETIGNAQISTAQSKWGGGSMAFDGTGDYLTVPDSPAWFLSTGNFTIELWIYFSSTASLSMLVQQGLNANNRWILYYSTTTGMSFDVASASVGIISCQQGSTAGWSINTWYHVALVRNGNAFNIYRNGTSIASATDTDSIPDFAGLLYIGGGAFSGDVSLNGYIDDLRITKFARYTANFTPPTAAFPTQ
jgi:hypothetical protein